MVCGDLRGLFSGREKELLNYLHGQEESVGLRRERDEVVFQVEGADILFCVDDNSPGRDVPRGLPGPFQGIHEQDFSEALALAILVHAHTAEKSDPDGTAGRQLLGKLRGKIRSEDG